MTDDLSTSLAAVLADHRTYWSSFAVSAMCECGWSERTVWHHPQGVDAMEAHVAQVLAESVSVLLSAAKRDAWNEAREAVTGLPWDQVAHIFPNPYDRSEPDA